MKTDKERVLKYHSYKDWLEGGGDFIFPEEGFKDVIRYIMDYWQQLLREPIPETEGDTILYLPNPYVVALNYNYASMYYWDSYFINQGLLVQGEVTLAKMHVDNFCYEIEHYGKALNSNRTFMLSRSQPPFLTSMIKDVYSHTRDWDWLKRVFESVRKEYNNYWRGKYRLTPTGLSRYFDESTEEQLDWWRKNADNFIATQALLSEAESGWDFTPRFGDARDINPVDLNCNLYQYEIDFSIFSKILGNRDESEFWLQKARERKQLVNQFMWDEETGLFYDYDFVKGKRRKVKSVAAYFPLWCGLAEDEQANRLVGNIPLFNYPGGMATCDRDYGEREKQWNYPNGWAPLQWIVIKGLERYGYHDIVSQLTYKWLRLNVNCFKETQNLWEKYNVVECNTNCPNRYPNLTGVGWTNSIFLALVVRIIFGINLDIENDILRITPHIPDEWRGKRVGASLPIFYGDNIEIYYIKRHNI